MPPTQKYQKCKKCKTCQNDNVLKLIALAGFNQNGLQIWIQLILLRIWTLVKIYFRLFRLWHLFDIIIIKNCIKLMFWRLGTMLERFFKAKSFGLHISNLKHNCWCFEDDCMVSMYHGIMAMYHGYELWLCIMAMYHAYVSRLCIMAMYHGYVSWLCITAISIYIYIYI